MVASIGQGARRKGAAFQNQIRSYLALMGFDPMARGTGDAGDDIACRVLPWFSFELKNHARPALPAWMSQATAAAGRKIPVVIWKRYGVTKPERQWVTLELAEFARLCNLLARCVDPRDWEALAGPLEGLRLVGGGPHVVPSGELDAGVE